MLSKAQALRIRETLKQDPAFRASAETVRRLAERSLEAGPWTVRQCEIDVPLIPRWAYPICTASMETDPPSIPSTGNRMVSRSCFAATT